MPAADTGCLQEDAGLNWFLHRAAEEGLHSFREETAIITRLLG